MAKVFTGKLHIISQPTEMDDYAVAKTTPSPTAELERQTYADPPGRTPPCTSVDRLIGRQIQNFSWKNVKAPHGTSGTHEEAATPVSSAGQTLNGELASHIIYSDSSGVTALDFSGVVFQAASIVTIQGVFEESIANYPAPIVAEGVPASLMVLNQAVEIDPSGIMLIDEVNPSRSLAEHKVIQINEAPRHSPITEDEHIRKHSQNFFSSIHQGLYVNLALGITVSEHDSLTKILGRNFGKNTIHSSYEVSSHFTPAGFAGFSLQALLLASLQGSHTHAYSAIHSTGLANAAGGGVKPAIFSVAYAELTPVGGGLLSSHDFNSDLAPEIQTVSAEEAATANTEAQSTTTNTEPVALIEATEATTIADSGVTSPPSAALTPDPIDPTSSETLSETLRIQSPAPPVPTPTVVVHDFTVTGAGTYTGTTENDSFTSTDANLTSAVTITAGLGTDTLIISDAANISTDDLSNVTEIEVISLGGNSTIALSNSFVSTSTSNSVEIANGAYTVNLDVTGVTGTVVIGGTGQVTLSAAGAVTAKDGVNTNITGSSGNDTLTGGTGNDNFNSDAGNDNISGGAGNDNFTFTDANFTSADSVAGGIGTDTLAISDAANLSTADLGNVSGVEVISVGGNSTVTLNDSIVGTADSDSLEINNSTYTLALSTGALTGSNQVVIGGTGAVTLAAGTADTVYAKDGVNTTIVATNSGDKIYGGTGNDTFTAVSSSGVIDGGAGDDTIYLPTTAYSTSTTITGGEGFDTAHVVSGALVMIITNPSGNYFTGFEQVVFGASVAFVNIQYNVVPTAPTPSTYDTSALGVGKTAIFSVGDNSLDFNITLIGGAEVNNIVLNSGIMTVDAGAGNDIFITRLDGQLTSADTFNGGSGLDQFVIQAVVNISADDLSGVSGVDQITFQGGSATSTLQLSDTFVDASDSDSVEIANATNAFSLNLDGVTHDVVIGGTGTVTLADGVDNTLVTKDGVNTTINGGTGNDTFLSGTGADTLDGGTGNDTVSYENRGSGITASLATGTASDGDTLANIDNLKGSAYADTLTGDNNDNTITAGQGNDVLTGNEGDDTFIFSVGDDANTVYGGNSTPGSGGVWTDIIQLADSSAGPVGILTGDPGDWTLTTSADYTIADNTLTFTDGNASGTATLSDGSTVTFTDIDEIHWS